MCTLYHLCVLVHLEGSFCDSLRIAVIHELRSGPQYGQGMCLGSVHSSAYPLIQQGVRSQNSFADIGPTSAALPHMALIREGICSVDPRTSMCVLDIAVFGPRSTRVRVWPQCGPCIFAACHVQVTTTQGVQIGGASAFA